MASVLTHTHDTAYSSPVRTRYGASVMGSKSELWCTFIIAMLYVIQCYKGLCHNEIHAQKCTTDLTVYRWYDNKTTFAWPAALFTEVLYIFWGNKTYICLCSLSSLEPLFSIISWHWDGAGNRSPYSQKARTCLFYIVNTMSADRHRENFWTFTGLEDR